MMSLAVAEDYSHTNPTEFASSYKLLLTLSLLLSTTICALSLSHHLGRSSAYLAPTTSLLTLLHALLVGTLCYRQSRLPPTFSPRGALRSPATRTGNLVASYTLYVLWVVTFVLLVIATTRAAYWFMHPPNAMMLDRKRAALEAGLSGVQACVTLVFAVLCTRDRRRFQARTQRQTPGWASWFL